MTETEPFRRQPKTDLNVWVPVQIAEDIRAEANESGHSIGLIVTKLLCRGMGRDPGQFGIFNPRKPRTHKASA